MTSFLLAELGLELLDAAVLGLLDAAIATVLDGSLEGLVGLGQDNVDPGMNLTRLQAKLFGKGRKPLPFQQDACERSGPSARG